MGVDQRTQDAAQGGTNFEDAWAEGVISNPHHLWPVCQKVLDPGEESGVHTHITNTCTLLITVEVLGIFLLSQTVMKYFTILSTHSHQQTEPWRSRPASPSRHSWEKCARTCFFTRGNEQVAYATREILRMAIRGHPHFRTGSAPQKAISSSSTL